MTVPSQMPGRRKATRHHWNSVGVTQRTVLASPPGWTLWHPIQTGERTRGIFRLSFASLRCAKFACAVWRDSCKRREFPPRSNRPRSPSPAFNAPRRRPAPAIDGFQGFRVCFTNPKKIVCTYKPWLVSGRTSPARQPRRRSGGLYENVSHQGHSQRWHCRPRRHRKDATGVVVALHGGHDAALGKSCGRHHHHRF